MDYLSLFSLGITALRLVAGELRNRKLAAAADIVEAAVAKLAEVHASEVTKAQLESLRG